MNFTSISFYNRITATSNYFTFICFTKLSKCFVLIEVQLSESTGQNDKFVISSRNFVDLPHILETLNDFFQSMLDKDLFFSLRDAFFHVTSRFNFRFFDSSSML